MIADVFVYKKPDGSILITDRAIQNPQYILEKTFESGRSKSPMALDSTKISLAGQVTKIKTPQTRFYPIISHYDSLIGQVSKLLKLDIALVKAIVHVESAFNAYAISNKGAVGLMQLMPKTAKAYGVKNSLDPAQNVAGGSRHLRDLLDYYNDDTRLALAAYNAGQAAVSKYGGIPPYRETQNYVQKVLALRKVYKEG